MIFDKSYQHKVDVLKAAGNKKTNRGDIPQTREEDKMAPGFLGKAF